MPDLAGNVRTLVGDTTLTSAAYIVTGWPVSPRTDQRLPVGGPLIKAEGSTDASGNLSLTLAHTNTDSEYYELEFTETGATFRFQYQTHYGNIDTASWSLNQHIIQFYSSHPDGRVDVKIVPEEGPAGPAGPRGRWDTHIYEVANAKPLRPQGGTVDPATGVVTPPAGWSNDPEDVVSPAKLWVSVAHIFPPSTDLAWSEPHESTGEPGTPGGPGPKGDPGDNGWTPALAVVDDGARRVIEITGWSGGTGTPPDTGYLGPGGTVGTLAAATDVRGAPGRDGNTFVPDDPTAAGRYYLENQSFGPGSGPNRISWEPNRPIPDLPDPPDAPTIEEGAVDLNLRLTPLDETSWVPAPAAGIADVADGSTAARFTRDRAADGTKAWAALAEATEHSAGLLSPTDKNLLDHVTEADEWEAFGAPLDFGEVRNVNVLRSFDWSALMDSKLYRFKVDQSGYGSLFSEQRSGAAWKARAAGGSPTDANGILQRAFTFPPEVSLTENIWRHGTSSIAAVVENIGQRDVWIDGVTVQCQQFAAGPVETLIDSALATHAAQQFVHHAPPLSHDEALALEAHDSQLTNVRLDRAKLEAWADQMNLERTADETITDPHWTHVYDSQASADLAGAYKRGVAATSDMDDVTLSGQDATWQGRMIGLLFTNAGNEDLVTDSAGRVLVRTQPGGTSGTAIVQVNTPTEPSTQDEHYTLEPTPMRADPGGTAQAYLLRELPSTATLEERYAVPSIRLSQHGSPVQTITPSVLIPNNNAATANQNVRLRASGTNLVFFLTWQIRQLTAGWAVVYNIVPDQPFTAAGWSAEVISSSQDTTYTATVDVAGADVWHALGETSAHGSYEFASATTLLLMAVNPGTEPGQIQSLTSAAVTVPLGDNPSVRELGDAPCNWDSSASVATGETTVIPLTAKPAVGRFVGYLTHRTLAAYAARYGTRWLYGIDDFHTISDPALTGDWDLTGTVKIGGVRAFGWQKEATEVAAQAASAADHTKLFYVV